MRTALGLLIGFCLAGQIKSPEPPAPTGAAANESVEVRYARAQLELADANLRRIRQMNQRAEKTVPDSVVNEYESDLAIAKERLDQALRGKTDDGFAVWLRRAEANWKAAESTWKRSAAVNQRAARTIEPADVERFRLRSEVARLQFERGQSLAKAPREAQLTWQVELVNNELELLREETTRLSPFTRYFPVWR